MLDTVGVEAGQVWLQHDGGAPALKVLGVRNDRTLDRKSRLTPYAFCECGDIVDGEFEALIGRDGRSKTTRVDVAELEGFSGRYSLAEGVTV